MKNILLAVIGSICLLFAGCDQPVGPVLVNETDRDLIVDAVFADGRSVHEVAHSRTIWWLGHKDAQLVGLRVFDGTKPIHNLEKAEIAAFENTNDDSVLILVIGELNIRAIPRKELKNLGRTLRPINK